MTDFSRTTQKVMHAYGDCIGGIDAVMGSEWRGLSAALRALADDLAYGHRSGEPILNEQEILDVATELESKW